MSKSKQPTVTKRSKQPSSSPAPKRAPAVKRIAEAASKRRRWFALSAEQERALRAHGIDPAALLARCYPMPREQIVSGSHGMVSRGYSWSGGRSDDADREVPF